MKAKNIRLFIKPWCGWCHEAVDWLDARGVQYQVLDVTEEAKAREEMRQLSGQTKAPVIEVDGQILADFDTDQLEKFWRQFEAA
ncbi:MAG TPA: glutaredoxin family protein [Verrucomicrobiae bacterium]|nr:glutaredoxin family protein [Verrucomicrobiae bacterium]